MVLAIGAPNPRCRCDNATFPRGVNCHGVGTLSSPGPHDRVIGSLVHMGRAHGLWGGTGSTKSRSAIVPSFARALPSLVLGKPGRRWSGACQVGARDGRVGVGWLIRSHSRPLPVRRAQGLVRPEPKAPASPVQTWAVKPGLERGLWRCGATSQRVSALRSTRPKQNSLHVDQAKPWSDPARSSWMSSSR